MKKTIAFIFIAAFCFCLLPGASALAEEQTYNLKLQTLHPPSLMGYMETFAKDVEAASNGRIKVQVFAGGELVDTSNMLKAVGTGTVDFANGVGGYYSELTIGNIETGLPQAWASPQEAQMIFDNFGLQEIIEKEYSKHGVKYLTSMWAIPHQILTKEPVNSLDDLRKMKIRAYGGSAKLLRSLGVNTVNMAPEDLYLGMSTGQIDGVLYGAAYEYKLNKYYEVAPYLLETPITDPAVDHMTMNLKLWESMPADLQQIIKMATDKMRWFHYLMVVSNYAKIKDETFKGVTVLPAEDQKMLVDAAKAVWDEEAARSPENAAAIKIIEDVAKMGGRL